MKAVLCTKYGPPEVIHIAEVQKPVPKSNEVLIRVRATTVTPSDVAFRKGRPFVSRFFTGLLRPKNIPGDVLTGDVEAVGKDVNAFRIGDRVFGSTGAGFGAQAEYKCLAESGALAVMPASLSHAGAASVSDGGLTALPFLRDGGKIHSGHKVLINGASGSVGTMAVQLAKHFGAEVTGVCSTTNLELVRSIGADEVIDYTESDFTKTGETFDIIFDVVANSSFSRCKGSLREGGIYLTTFPSPSVMLRRLVPSGADRKKAKFMATGLRSASEKAVDLLFLKGLCEAGKIRPVIDRTYGLDQIAEAHRYVEKGHKKGNVVIQL
ncbi:MAG TPA: NAD(P)-dependent alcohol dehydrogenase [Methanomassiliicoccales archaeon]|jgi:NADPH:quinone reductase-like Zn-dependent oxidoreductase